MPRGGEGNRARRPPKNRATASGETNGPSSLPNPETVAATTTVTASGTPQSNIPEPSNNTDGHPLPLGDPATDTSHGVSTNGLSNDQLANDALHPAHDCLPETQPIHPDPSLSTPAPAVRIRALSSPRSLSVRDILGPSFSPSPTPISFLRSSRSWFKNLANRLTGNFGPVPGAVLPLPTTPTPSNVTCL
jgi:hypothetical protein